MISEEYIVGFVITLIVVVCAAHCVGYWRTRFNMWPFGKKNVISPDHPEYQQIMDNLQCSQVDITDKFGDNLSMKPDEWIETHPMNQNGGCSEFHWGLPPIGSSAEKIYEVAKGFSALREQVNIPSDGVYCPVCHIANTQLSKLHAPCPRCERELLKFGWD